MPIQFNNTEIAFEAKSNWDLRRSYWLFKSIEYPWFVKLGSSAAKVALQLGLPVQKAIEATIFRQFCGGETVEECASTIQRLSQFGIGTILDYSVEGLGTEESFDSTLAEVLRTVELAVGNPAIPFCVIKMTAIARLELMAKISEGKALSAAEKMEWQRALARLDKLCNECHAKGVRLLVDAEETWIQKAIDEAVEDRMARLNRGHATLYNTIQMYRTDRLEFLRQAIDRAKKKGYVYGIKLVRGAYMEKERERAERLGLPSPIQPNKAATDRAYDEALRACLAQVDHVALCAGSHNETSTRLLAELMQKQGLERSDPRIYFSQLLGMSDNISHNLAHEGYLVAKYVPYGPVRAVFPYLVRRAQENTSIQGQTGRELGLITKEWQRRKKSGDSPTKTPGGVSVGS